MKDQGKIRSCLEATAPLDVTFEARQGERKLLGHLAGQEGRGGDLCALTYIPPWCSQSKRDLKGGT